MAEPVQDPRNVWDKATALQLLKLLKLLGVTQKAMVHHLGVSRSAVSFWMTGRRAMPRTYRAGLVQWLAVAYHTAQEDHQHEVQRLPTPALQAAARTAFLAPLHRWAVEVLHARDDEEAHIRAVLHGLHTVLDNDPWTVDDVAALRRGARELGTRLTHLA